MKKGIVYTTVGIIAIALFACHKYTSVENGKGLAAEMEATIDGVSWEAADSTPIAIISQGFVTISGLSADDREISISLNDTVVGAYVLNQTSTSIGAYANVDSAAYFYSTSQGSDTAQAGGMVNVISVDHVNRTISGIFSFKVYRNSDGAQKDITAGVFYNIPYVDQ
jgi:hypothetical protein